MGGVLQENPQMRHGIPAGQLFVHIGLKGEPLHVFVFADLDEALAAAVARTRNGMEGRLLDAPDMMNRILSSSDPPSPMAQAWTGARNADSFNASATVRRQLP